MNSKKTLIIIVVVIIILIASAFFWNNTKTEFVRDSSNEGLAPLSQSKKDEQTGNIGKMTDEIYVEILSEIAYFGKKDPTSWAQSGFQELLNKYGVTEENYIAYGELLKKDTNHATVIAQKYTQRLEELERITK